MCVGVGVLDGVNVRVGVGLMVGVAVRVRVKTTVGVRVRVGVGVYVRVRIGVRVGVPVGTIGGVGLALHTAVQKYFTTLPLARLLTVNDLDRFGKVVLGQY